MWWTVALMAAVQVPYASHTGLDTSEQILCGSAAWPRLESPGSKDIWDQNQNTGAKESETARYTATLPGPAHGEPVVPTWPVRPGHGGSIDGARRNCGKPRPVDLDYRKSSGPAQPEEETRNEPFPNEPPPDGGSHESHTIPFADPSFAMGGRDGSTITSSNDGLEVGGDGTTDTESASQADSGEGTPPMGAPLTEHDESTPRTGAALTEYEGTPQTAFALTEYEGTPPMAFALTD